MHKPPQVFKAEDTLVPSEAQFASAINELRAKRKLTRSQLSFMAGIGVGALERVEQQKQRPSLTTAIGLAYALGVTVDELIAAAFEYED